MHKLTTAALITFLLCFHSVAAEPEKGESFYNKSIDQLWTVFGNRYTKNSEGDKNSGCIAEASWDDGSRLQIIKDLVDGELYIWINNIAWSITDPVKQKYTLRLNLYNGNRVVESGTIDYYLLNKNTMAIRNLAETKFTQAFFESTRMLLVPPGTIQNMTVSLGGNAKRVLASLAECVRTFSKREEVPSLSLKEKI